MVDGHPPAAPNEDRPATDRTGPFAEGTPGETYWRQSIGHAFRFAGSGLRESLPRQRNLQIQWAGAMAILCWCLVVRPAVGWVSATVGVCALVMAFELLNTAVEHAVDLVAGRTYHELARLAKDAAAGAVLLSSFGAAAFGISMLVATLPWRWNLWTSVHPIGAVESSLALAALVAWVVQSCRRGRSRANEDSRTRRERAADVPPDRDRRNTHDGR
ncbi:MAG: diacylglycerol kinase [Alicyclobacillus sp.]|nr:diacylglycerol kinase [Alicyclobacillus sp.]